MCRAFKFLKLSYKELIYQVALVVVLFVFFSYHQDDTESVSIYSLFLPYKFAFFGNYIICSIVINYVLLPKFYYKKQGVLFFIITSLLIGAVILIDEFILEKIFFPDTRGKYFPGVLFTLIETLPIIIIMVAFKFAWDFNKKQGEIVKLKTLVKESELQFLKSQINPHFLFNNLNNLYSYSLDNSPKTSSIILELSSVLRYMLYDCQENFVSLAKEVKHLHNFTALYELQIENRGQICFHQQINSSRHQIAPLILIIFIENAFKYSTDNQIDNIIIDISIDVTENGLLTFYCENNYIPRKEASTNAKGIGLKNVKKRLNLLYPKKHKLTITDNNKYVVQLSMQL
jgi:sensor histidine kinase YesM